MREGQMTEKSKKVDPITAMSELVDPVEILEPKVAPGSQIVFVDGHNGVIWLWV